MKPSNIICYPTNYINLNFSFFNFETHSIRYRIWSKKDDNDNVRFVQNMKVFAFDTFSHAQLVHLNNNVELPIVRSEP